MELWEMMKILSDETRFKIIEMLLKHDLCVGALAANLGISESAVSQHIQVLRKGGILKGEKRGYWTHYIVERDALEEMSGEFSKWSHQPSASRAVCPRESMPAIKRKKEDKSMCECKCQQPEKLKGEPGKCSIEQIKECHGDEAAKTEKEKK